MIARCASCAARDLKKCGCFRRQSVKVRQHLRSVAKKGSLAAAAKKRRAAAERWGRLAQGMTRAELAKAFYRKGYVAAYNRTTHAAYRRGYAAGYEACAKAMHPWKVA